MITNFIQLDFNKENDLKVPSVQYDSGSRFVKIKLQRNKSPFKIDGYRVTVVANKVDGTEIMNDCTILDGVNGVVQFEITEQFNAVEGVVDCQLKLFKGKTLLTSMPFSINVVKSVSTKEIVSSNELKTLVNALGEVQNIDNRFAETNAQLSQQNQRIEEFISHETGGNMQQAHSHVNKTTLDKLTESSTGKLVFDGKEIGTDISAGSIVPSMTTFLKTTTVDVIKVNRGLLASDERFYYKQPYQEEYDTFNLFLVDVENVEVFKNLAITGGVVVRIKGIKEYDCNKFKEILESTTSNTPINIGDTLLMSNNPKVNLTELNVVQYRTMAVYVGQNAEMSIKYDESSCGITLSDEVKIDETNLKSKLTKNACDFINPNIVISDTDISNVEYTYNNDNNILSTDTKNNKLYCYKNTDNNFTPYCVMLELAQGIMYTFNASNLSRCRIAVFYDKGITDLVFGKAGIGTYADEVLYNNDLITEVDFEYISKHEKTVIILYLGGQVEPDLIINRRGTEIDGYHLDKSIKITSENLKDGSIPKSALAFEFRNTGSTRMPKLNNVLTSSTKEINLIYEMQPASNQYVTDSSGKILNISSDQFLDLYYDRYVGKHADGLVVNKTDLGKDESGLYNIYEYDFIPPFYTDTILLTSGMHTYELSAHFGLAHFFEHYMQYDKENGYLSDGFEYLRKYIRIKVIAIVNPWGWNQTPKKYGNVNGVNINRNFDYPDENGNSTWDKFPVYTPQQNEWNVKGSAPFSEAESRILRDWALSNLDALYWIDCHTGLGLGPWDNFIYYNSKSPLVPQIKSTLSILEDRIRTKYNKQNPTKELRIDDETSIRLDWSEYMGVPSFTIEQTPNNPLWGTSLNNESGDITEFAVTVYAYVLGFLNPVNVDAESWIKSFLQVGTIG